MKKLIIIITLFLIAGIGCNKSNDNSFELAKQKEECMELGKKVSSEYRQDFLFVDDEYAYNQKLNTCLWFRSVERIDSENKVREDRFIMDLYKNKTIEHTRLLDGKVFEGSEIDKFSKIKDELFAN